VDRVVTGQDAVDGQCAEAVQGGEVRVDGVLVSVVEADVHGHRPERPEGHVAGEQPTLVGCVVQVDQVVGLVARRVDGIDREAAEVDGLARFDPVVDGIGREEAAVAFERLDGHVDGLFEVLAAEACSRGVPGDRRFEVVGVPLEPVRYARGRVQRRVGRLEQGRYLPDVVDVWVRDDQVFEVG
jgi:hypothetical protein